ncbi:SPOR domain-containing protein [Pigmentiphaga sp.]|uniref:SPOR domain-containing protein n=1 Tax=Pigmentiphaga sp. TaxID=1977564 RepID=UPI0025FFB2A9|nr:SPOR domain-containing protein [Pigmentiphaga sp.]
MASTAKTKTPRGGKQGGASHRQAAPKRAVGGTMFGLMAGLLVGLLVAVLVAFYITKAPVPFVSKGTRPPAAPAQPSDPANAPDPNRSLYGKDGPAGAPSASGPSASQPAPAPVPQATRDPLGDFLASQNVDKDKKGAQPPAPSAAAPSQAPAPAQAPGATGSGTYFLQVGAYRVIEDAEALKAKLAFMGFEARLETADVAAGTVHRVRVGPFTRLDDMNRTRARLAENGIEAAVVKK